MSMTHERRFRFRTSAKPEHGPTVPATPTQQPVWLPRRDGSPACGIAYVVPPAEVRQRLDATTTVTRREPIGKPG
jgi:hypothetical protein